MTGKEPVKPPNLRLATEPECCGKCFRYKPLDDYKELFLRFGPNSPLVHAYGYGEEYLVKDGICEVSGDPPVLKSELCDNFMPAW
jgi:hypothetical protein